MGFGANVEQRINAKALKKCKVAEAVGINNSRLSKIMHEKTEADSKEILALCNFLETTPNELFGYSKK